MDQGLILIEETQIDFWLRLIERIKPSTYTFHKSTAVLCFLIMDRD